MSYKAISAAVVATAILAIGARAATLSVNCPSSTIQAAVDLALPGDLIAVSGSCSENVLIRNDKQLIVIDGGGTASVNGPNASKATFDVKGKGVSIRGFTISGGNTGVLVSRSSNAGIQNNVIQSTSGYGVVLANLAFAAIFNNVIQNHPLDGIYVSESSNARIGYNISTDAAPSPNTIQNNGRYGVFVNKSSSANIYGNTIASNGDSGVYVGRGSSADIANNVIGGNGTAWVSGTGGNGVAISMQSFVQLGRPGGTWYGDLPNTTTVNNANFGVRCSMNSSIWGRWGNSNQLNGTTGQTDISGSCATDMTPG